MKNKINGLIEKWDIQLAFRNGQEGLAVTGKPTAAQIAELRDLKDDIIAELKRREDEFLAASRAKAAAFKAAQQKESRAIKAGEKSIELRWHDGEYLSGHEAVGEAGGLLEELGLAKYLNGWGYHVNMEAVEALGESFTYDQAAELARPAQEKEAAKEAAAEAKRQARFDEARETGEPVLLSKWTEDCSDPREECSLDICCQYAMPDGSVKTERQHTW